MSTHRHDDHSGPEDFPPPVEAKSPSNNEDSGDEGPAEEAPTVTANSDLSASPALSLLLQSGYQAVHLIHFFTVQKRDGAVTAWMVREGTTAPQAAAKMFYDLVCAFCSLLFSSNRDEMFSPSDC